METLSLLTMSLIRAYPSVREFVIPFHPSLVKRCGPNFVAVVDELSQQLVRNGLIERGDMRFDYNFDTEVLTVIFPNRRLFPCGAEDDDPDQLTCYFGLPMRPYRTMREGVSVGLVGSINLLGAVCTQKPIYIHPSCLHPYALDTAMKLKWPEDATWEGISDKSGFWFTLTKLPELPD